MTELTPDTRPDTAPMAETAMDATPEADGREPLTPDPEAAETAPEADEAEDPILLVLAEAQTCVDNGEPEDALDKLETLAAQGMIDPECLFALIVRADARRMLGLFDEASADYLHAARLGSEYTALLWRRNAECLLEAKDLTGAMESLRRALSLDDTDVQAHYLLGQLLFSSTLHTQAICHARYLLQHADEDLMLATAENIYRFSMLPLEAYNVVKRRAELGAPGAFLGLLLCGAQGILDWDTAETYTKELEERFYSEGDFATSREIPLYNIARIADEAVNLAVAREAVRQHMDTEPAFDLSRHWKEHGPRIRIGLLSADFASHPVIQLIIGLLERMDKERFELVAYDDGKNENTEEPRLVKTLHTHTDVREQTDQAVAQMVYDDKIDVLIDLMGLTTKNRQGVLALRPCPVTATFLGFPGTSGLPSLDYVITDRIITPDSSKPHYAEKLCRLPETFMPNDNGRLVAANPVCRADLGLPEDRVVFCSFNRSFKLDKNTVHLWMRVLSRVPGSVLWQKSDEPNMMRVFRETAALYGVDPERIIFAGSTGSVALHLSRAGLADIGLDTLIYNGHTITADLLWAGVPVVTCTGTHFASRVSTSLLTAVGLPELVAETPQAMEDLAVALALNPARLRALREKLAENRGRFPLFDTERYTRHFETAITMMVDRAREGLAPDHLDIPALPPRTESFLPDGPPRVEEEDQGLPDGPYSDISITSALQKTPYALHYAYCPMCGELRGTFGMPVTLSDHPHWSEPMSPQVFWLCCPECGHHHTVTFWDGESRNRLQLTAARPATPETLPAAWQAFAPVVRHLWQTLQPTLFQLKDPPCWLGLGTDDGLWGLVAASFGFLVTETDCAPQVALHLRSKGIPAWTNSPLLSTLTSAPGVIALNHLERVPYPDIVLDWAHTQLVDEGRVVFSHHETDSPAMNVYELDENFPLLKDPARLHMFGRKNVRILLQRNGFEVETVFPDPIEPLFLYIVAKKIHTATK